METNAMKYGLITAGHPQTAEAGMEVLAAGGNAFDAAVAASLASFITEAALTCPAGGGFLLARKAGGWSRLYDFFVQTPMEKALSGDADFYPVYVDFGDAVQEFHIGMASMGVPGNLAGLFHVHRQLGAIPMKEVAAPAIALAKEGVTINAFQASCMKLMTPILSASAGGRRVFCHEDGSLLQTGDGCKMPRFADTLEYLSTHGIREFYEGEIAARVAADCREKGGYLQRRDFEQYRVIERTPLTIPYRHYHFLTNPPPSAGGILIAFALRLLEHIDPRDYAYGSGDYIRLMAKAQLFSNLARQERLNQAIYKQRIAREFLHHRHFGGYAPLLLQKDRWGATTHISVMDTKGNAASITTSSGQGSGYVIPQTDILMNNMLGEADLNPSGFHNWTPARRISSMMAPSMLIEKGMSRIISGTGGSNRIRSAILQVITNLADYGMGVEQAVQQPRIHLENNTLDLEYGIDLNQLDGIEEWKNLSIKSWTRRSMYFGGAHTIVCKGPYSMEAAGDNRRDGLVMMI